MSSYIWFQRALPLMKNPLPNQTMSGSKFCASRQEFRKIKWFRRWGLVCRTGCCGTVLTLQRDFFSCHVGCSQIWINTVPHEISTNTILSCYVRLWSLRILQEIYLRLYKRDTSIC